MTSRLTAVLALTLAAGPLVAQPEEYDCLIEPATVLRVASPESGLLADVPVARGDTVAEGDVVARLDSRVQQTTFDLMEERAASRAEEDAQAARLALSQSQRDRVRTLVERNIAAAGELEEAEATVEVARGELSMAEMRRRIAELELERARELTDRLTIRSPIDGVVTRTLLFEGEFTDQNNPIMEIAQIDPLHVEVFLPVSAYASVAIGDTATIRPAAPVEGSYVGTISVIDRVFDAGSGTFGLQVKLDNPDLTLPAGLRCTVSF